MDTGKKIAIEIQSLYHGTAAVIEFPSGSGCMHILYDTKFWSQKIWQNSSHPKLVNNILENA